VSHKNSRKEKYIVAVVETADGTPLKLNTKN
jgi:hypothetical protein